MARFKFGGTAGDFIAAVGPGGTLRALPAQLTLWTAQTGGDQVTDLRWGGQAVTVIPVAAGGQIPVFEGPDAVTALWADAGYGTRTRLLTQPADLTSVLDEAAARAEAAAALAAEISGLDDVAGAVTLLDADATSQFRQQADAREMATVAALTRPSVTPPIDPNMPWLSSRIQHSTVPAGPGDRTVVVSTGNPQESSHYVDSAGLMHRIMTQSGGIRHFTCPAGADPLVPGNWTTAGTLIASSGAAALYTIGSGNPGRSGVMVLGEQIFIYFTDTAGAHAKNVYLAVASAQNPASDCKIVTGRDGSGNPTFEPGDPLSVRVMLTGEAWFGNNCPVKDGDTYRLFHEATFGVTYHGKAIQDWFVTQCTSTSPAGPFTRQTYGGSPIMASLRPPDGYGDKGAGYAGQIIKEGDTWVAVFHAAEHLGITPNVICRATNTNLATDTWKLDPEPLIRRAHPVEVDQVADPSFFRDPATGIPYMFWEGYDNGTDTSILLGCQVRPRLLRPTATPGVYAPASAGSAPRLSVLELPQTVNLGLPWIGYAAKSAGWTVDDTYSGRMYATAVGSWVEFDVLLAPGVWVVRIGIQLSETSGMVAASLTSSAPGPTQKFQFPAIGTVDAYRAAGSGTSTPRGVLDFPSLALYGSEPQRRRLRLTVATKNPAATTGFVQLTGPVSVLRVAGS